jgi:glycosyltransferase involved in cell wall biosynthesis
MKIAHVTTIDGSLRRLLLNQLLEIRAAGHEVVGISSPGAYVPHIENAGIRHISVPIARSVSPLRDLATLWQLVRIFRRERFDLVHTHNPKPGLLGQIAARWARVPLVVNTVHGFYFDEHRPTSRRRFWIALERLAARCSDVILSQNQEDLDTALRERITSPDKIRFLGNGIDIQRFSAANVDQRAVERLRAELDLTPNTPTLGFIGRFVREKGILELFEAIAIAKKESPGIRVLLAGRVDNDRGDAVFPDRTKEYGIEKNCQFLGLREEIPEILSLLDVLVLPSHREGFPRAPMEAAAMGIPVIVTDVRGCRETTEHGRNGLLVPLKDPRALAAAILRILADPSAAAQMGKEGRRMAEERFDERIVFRRVLQEYQRLSQGLGLPNDVRTPDNARSIGQAVGHSRGQDPRLDGRRSP